MRVPKITEERREAVRNRLVDAAVTLMHTAGPAEVTTRAILEQAGLSAGALYHYFASKDELFEAVAQRYVDDDPALRASPDTDAAGLGAWHVAVLASLFGRDAHSILPQLRLAAATNEPVRASLDRYDQALIERGGALNRQSQEAGLFVADLDAEALAELVEIFYEGFVLRDRLDAFGTSRGRVVALFFELLGARALDPTSPEAAAVRRALEELAHS